MDEIKGILKFVFLKGKETNDKGATNEDYTFIASKEIVDRDKDIVRVKGISLKNYKSNPVVMSIHSWNKMPIGKVTKTKLDGDTLLATVKFAGTDAGIEAKQLVDEGMLNAVSIGFDVPDPKNSVYLSKDILDYYPTGFKSFDDLKEDYPEYHSSISKMLKNARRVFYSTELLEISLVPIPANQDALLVAASKGIKNIYAKSFDGKLMEMELPEIKAAIPFSIHSNMVLNEKSAWDATVAVKSLRKAASSDDSGNKDKINWKKYRAGFTWFDSTKLKAFGSYKLPHHEISGGKFEVNWNGVHTAMGSLLGSRGGVAIPEGDRKAVYNHLAKHYKQFNKTVPKFKDYTVVEAIETLDEDTAKSIIVAKNFKELKGEIMTDNIDKLKADLDIATNKVKELDSRILELTKEIKEVSSPSENKSDADKEDKHKESKGYSLDRDELKTYIRKVAFAALRD